MIRTFNRNPVNFGKPSKNADSIKHSNTYKFKGLIDDKNFLNVDQDSFSDCLNVYVNSEELLRSRPSLKEDKIIVKLDTGDVVLSNILDVETFGDVTVYKSKNNDTYYFTFVNKDFEQNLQTECEENTKLVLSDKKIFVFSQNSFTYYDIEDNKYYDASEFIYKPITKYFVDNLETDDINAESTNILTNSDIYQYIFTNVTKGDFSQLVGQSVTITLNDKTYDFVFTENKNYVFVDKFTVSNKLSNNEYQCVLGRSGQNYLMISSSDKGNFVASEYELVSDEKSDTFSFNREYSYKYYYSSNGLLYNRLEDLEGSFTDAKITHNGFHAITMKKDGPYIISLVETDEANYKYSSWTNLFSVLEHNESYNFNDGDYSNYLSDGVGGIILKNNTTINFDAVDDENFTIVYGKSPVRNMPMYNYLFCGKNYGASTQWNNFKSYSELECIYCVNKIISKKTITRVSTKQIRYSGEVGNGTIKMSTPEQEDECELKIANCISSTDTNLKVTHITFIWAFVRHGVTLESGNFSQTLYNKNSNVDETYPRYYDQIVNGKYSSPLFRVEADFVSSEQVDVIVTPGYYFLDDNDSTFIHGLSYEGNSFIYDGYKPQIKMDKLSTDKFGIHGGIYGIQTNEAFNKYLCTNKLYFKIFDEYYDEDVVPERIRVGINTYDDVPVISSIYDRSPLADSLFVKLYKYGTNYTCVFNRVTTYRGDHSINSTNVEEVEENYNSTTSSNFISAKTQSDKTRFVFSNLGNYVLCDTSLYKLKYDATNPFSNGLPLIPVLLNIDLLETAFPLNVVEQQSFLESIMCYTVDNNLATIYKTPDKININVVNNREINYFLPSYVAELENYYFSKNEKLYINQRRVNKNNKFLWYFPENLRQVYNYDITNLHPISTSEMAVFFDDEIHYITYDTNINNYRDIKTRLGIGCKSGSNVITTYDGKYTIFTTNRGLVAMSYQEFISSTEQSLTYLSDNVYDIFINYIKNGQIKLHKHGFWLFIYRQDNSTGYLFDLRTNSWWPMKCIHNVQKLYDVDNTLFILSNNTVLKLDTGDVNYYDVFNNISSNIPWKIKSQKMHLNAVNYNKLIFNMTFASVHDLELLEKANISITDTKFKLQVRNYRKVITGDIDTESSIIINYNVNAARTFVQRMNYGNVTEFEYLLSYDNESDYNIPLSLSSISVKYKIGGPVR